MVDMLTVNAEYWNGIVFPGKPPRDGLYTLQLGISGVEKDYAMEMKTVIFLVDVSGSMENTLPSVRASLLAFRDVMVGGRVFDQVSADKIFRERCHTEVITFSDIVREAWSSSSPSETFEDVVMNLKAGGNTNMGDALRLAFTKCSSDKVSWIVALTDGVSNTGSCQTLEAFTALVSQKPETAKIVTLGYGTSFNPDILMATGAFTYLEDNETISYLMGGLYHEISTAKFFNVRHELTIPVKSMDVIMGSHDVGVMFGERSFIFGAFISDAFPLTVKITYTEIAKSGLSQKYSVHFYVVHGPTSLPEKVMKAYYISEASRYIDTLYHEMQTGNKNRGVFDRIKREVSIWTEECSLPSREQVLRILDKVWNARGNSYHSAMSGMASIKSAGRSQASYVMPMHMTPSAIENAQQTLVYSEEYH